MRKKRKNQDYRSYITKGFTRWAKIYDPFISVFRLQGARKEAVEMTGATDGDRVLDVCTGTGETAMAFADRCNDVTGVDLTEAMLAIAKKKDAKNRIRFMQMDASKLDFKDKEFDVSSVSFGLHDMPSEVREEVLAELARVTKRAVLILDYNPPKNPLLRASYIGLISLYESKYFREFCKIDFADLTARFGLQIVKEKTAWLGFMRIYVCKPV